MHTTKNSKQHSLKTTHILVTISAKWTSLAAYSEEWRPETRLSLSLSKHGFVLSPEQSEVLYNAVEST